MNLAQMREAVGRLPEDSAERREAEELLAQVVARLEANPLEQFHACPEYCGLPGCAEPNERNPKGGRPWQFEFMSAPEFIVASNAGNRTGKTTALVVWAIIQHAPEQLVPKRLRAFKRARSKVVQGRYICPSEEWFEDNALPVFKRWTPVQMLREGKWEKAYRKHPGNVIHFADGGKLSVPTYKQDADALSGWEGDYVEWDEPPPEGHWKEMAIRVLDRGGCHRFGMTPVNMKGGGIGWVKRRIFDRARPTHPDHKPGHIRVVQASIWDNPQYSTRDIEQILAEYPEEERQAREHGTFLHFGGMVYPDWHRHLVDPPDPDRIRGRDVVVGIDPGYKAAAFVWVAFDGENRGLVFAEAYVEKGTALDYVRAIRQTNERWGVKSPLYVLDPYHGHKHGNTDGQTVAGELVRQGIYTCNPVVLDKDAIVYGGCQQIWRRMRQRAFAVSKDCRRLTAEAEEYRIEDRPDGVFQVVKEFDDGMDAMRYAFTWRPWYVEQEPVREPSVWVPGEAPPQSWFTGVREAPPMGAMS
jgi:hypothetical protein